MQAELREYQRYAAGRIISTPAVALFLDMGLGKTLATLTAIKELMFDRFEVQRVLVIAPLRVAQSTWLEEIRTWDSLKSLRVSLVLGSPVEREKALKCTADIFVTNRENVAWLVNHYGRRWPFDMVVIDESSSFKNPAAKRFKALRRVMPLTRRRVLLTGTPAPNSLMDLWSQFYLLDQGKRLERTISEYRRKYFTPGQQSGHVVYNYNLRKGADKEIFGRIEDISVSMKSEDYLALPSLVQNVISVELSTAAMAKYKSLERDFVLELGAETEITATSAAALSNKLLQMANGRVYSQSLFDINGETKSVTTIHEAKLDALSEIIELSEKKPVMVIYAYRHDLEALKARYPKARELKTSEDIRAWNEGKIELLLMHPASAGHGLNLQHGGHIAVWYGLTWSLELYQQANKRLHRTGQKERVILHHLVAKGTMDEEVMKALKSKASSQESLLQAVRARVRAYKEQQVEKI